jgi:hypothetical protein
LFETFASNVSALRFSWTEGNSSSWRFAVGSKNSTGSLGIG